MINVNNLNSEDNIDIDSNPYQHEYFDADLDVVLNTDLNVDPDLGAKLD